MTWQARGGGGSFRGGGLGGGGGFGGFGGGFTPFGKKIAIFLTACYFTQLLFIFWLGFEGTAQALAMWPVNHESFRPWQLFTYAFAGGRSPFGFLLSLVTLYFFGDRVERYFGTGRFMTFIAVVILAGGVIGGLLGAVLPMRGVAFGGFEGVNVAMICAFGWLERHATIYLIVLPIQAIFFVYLSIFFAVAGFLMQDAASLYLLTGIGVAYATTQRGVRLPDARRKWLEMKEKRLKRRLKKFDVIQGGGKKKSSNGSPDEPKEWLH